MSKTFPLKQNSNYLKKKTLLTPAVWLHFYNKNENEVSQLTLLIKVSLEQHKSVEQKRC